MQIYFENIIFFSKMNGNFRKPEYVKRYEYTYFDLETPLNAIVPNNARQRKDNYRFVVDNTSEANPIDWYNAYLEVDFQLVTLADSNVGITAGPNNGNQDATTTNGNTFIKEIQVECNGTSVTLSKLFSVFPEWKIPQEIKIEIDLRGIITRFYA